MKPIHCYIPNTITCLNLLSGAVACILSFKSTQILAGGLYGYQWAFIFIGAACVFDFLDGAMARLLKAFSSIGKDLDSLSDLVSFGLAPSLLMYNFMTSHTEDSLVCYISLWIALMGALRLAKFNVDTRQTTSFIGLPIPANALFWIGTVDWIAAHGYPGNLAMCILIFLFPLLMVSNLPLFSLKFKNFDWRENFRRYVLILACVIFLITDGVPGLAWTIVFYIVLAVCTRRKAAAA